MLSSPIITDIVNPTALQVTSIIERLDSGKLKDAFLILEDRRFDNAFMQAAKCKKNSYIVEYRDETTRRQYQSPRISKAAAITLLLTYLRKYESPVDGGMTASAVSWKDITDEL